MPSMGLAKASNLFALGLLRGEGIMMMVGTLFLVCLVLSIVLCLVVLQGVGCRQARDNKETFLVSAGPYLTVLCAD